jgi:hypothetical protein
MAGTLVLAGVRKDVVVVSDGIDRSCRAAFIFRYSGRVKENPFPWPIARASPLAMRGSRSLTSDARPAIIAVGRSLK